MARYRSSKVRVGERGRVLCERVRRDPALRGYAIGIAAGIALFSLLPAFYALVIALHGAIYG